MCINDIEVKFNGLLEQIKQLQQGNESNETGLNYLRKQLIKISQELNNPSNMSSPPNSQPLINDILIISSKKPKFMKWKQNTITVVGENIEVEKLKLNRPQRIFIDRNKHIFIADFMNHRVIEWECNANTGQIIAGGNGKGYSEKQLSNPIDVIFDQQTHFIIIADLSNRRVIQWMNKDQQILIHNIDCYGLAMDKNRFLYVSDYKNNEVLQWKISANNKGIVVAGGNGPGHQLNQLDSPTFIFVDEYQSVYVSDRRIVAGSNSNGENLNQISKPEGIFVDDSGQIYVADYGNRRIMRWYEGKGELVVGGYKPDQLSGLMG
ncbi:unnamed protein product [Adineta steineri]|uniref:NHL repeat containing protein n=1 Tax=Adineta steineri TaxID=433720 RepID=A0A815T5K0_9BILA|nr:unnamed protein product [Adineta steineri]CAF1503304.1 unnamed protein product [Adineta steineri]CAF1504100.1 unnamed protein product [Adineta steineri]